MNRDLQKNGRLPHEQELDIGKEKIVAPTIFEASAALDEHKIAELSRFIDMHKKFKVRYNIGIRSGGLNGSCSIESNSNCVLRVHKDNAADLLIPLNEIISLTLIKLE